MAELINIVCQYYKKMNYTQGHVDLIKAPDDLKGLLELRKKLNLTIPIGQLKEIVKELPCTIIDKMTDVQFVQLLMTSGLQGYLLFVGDKKVDTSFAAWCAHKGAAEMREQGETVLEPQIADPRPFYRLARLLSDNDATVMEEIRFAGGQAAAEYFAARREQFMERGIQTMTQLAAFSSGEIWLLGLVDVLIKQHYACELDWKEPIEEFAGMVSQLFVVRTEGLPVNNFGLFEDDDVEIWIERVNQAWRPLDFVLLTIDIDSDSYVLAPARRQFLTDIQEIALEAGIKVSVCG